jgi:hypothetical protein
MVAQPPSPYGQQGIQRGQTETQLCNGANHRTTNHARGSFETDAKRKTAMSKTHIEIILNREQLRVVTSCLRFRIRRANEDLADADAELTGPFENDLEVRRRNLQAKVGVNSQLRETQAVLSHLEATIKQ